MSLERRTREALEVAKRYNRTEDAFSELYSALREVERAVFAVHPDETNPIKREAQAALNLPGDLLGMDIQAIMDVAAKTAEALLKSTLCVIKYDGVILPPGYCEIDHEDGSKEWELPKKEERFRELVSFLEGVGVYLDDISVTESVVTHNMMRSEPYRIVHIPGLERMILVCDEVGEATFVLKGYFGTDLLARYTKEDLQIQFPNAVRRIVRVDKAQWEAELQICLFNESAFGLNERLQTKKKIDVRNQEALRQAFIVQYPTVQDWINMGPTARKKLTIDGHGIKALANLFSVAGNVQSSALLQLQLAEKIYGESEKLTAAIRQVKAKEKVRRS